MESEHDETADPQDVDATTWTAEDVGDYLQVSSRKVKELVTMDLGFPAPVVLGPRTFRWCPLTVRTWFRQQQEAQPKVRDQGGSRRIVERV